MLDDGGSGGPSVQHSASESLARHVHSSSIASRHLSTTIRNDGYPNWISKDTFTSSTLPRIRRSASANSVSTVRSSGSAARPKLLTPPAAVITLPPSTSDSNGVPASQKHSRDTTNRYARGEVACQRCRALSNALTRSLRSAVSVGAGRTSSRAGDGGAGSPGGDPVAVPATPPGRIRRSEQGQP